MPTNKHIVVIGAANADITGISTEPLRFNESNPGRMNSGAGGVGRNIADNFARLATNQNIDTYLLSALGDDVYGKMVLEESLKANIDMSQCQILAGQPTAAYFSIVDYNGEMRSAISDMSIVDSINVDYLSTQTDLINSAELIVLDANLSQSAIDFICINFNHIPIFVDSVSAVKAIKITANIKHIYCLTPNLNEAEILSGINIRNDNDLAKVASFFHANNIQHLFITLGSNGIYISSLVDGLIMQDHRPAFQGDIINSNGAGDAFMAGIIFAHMQGINGRQQVDFAQACAFLNCTSEHTIDRELSFNKVTEFLETK